MSKTQYIFLILLCTAAVAAFFLWPYETEPSLPSNEARLLQQEEADFATSTASTTPDHHQNVSSVRVPILVYHIVRPSYPSDTAAVKEFAVTPEIFDEEMAYLRDNGYHVIPFSALENYFYKGTPLPSRPVILNFDDAWEDQYVYAFPILEKYHYTATFFVPTNFPGQRSFLAWDQLRTIAAAGMTIGSHSESHPYLTSITSTSTLWKEIYGSKQVLQNELGTTTDEFDYPFGMYNNAIMSMVEAAGYKAARADYLGLNQSRTNIYKLGALNAPTDMLTFAAYFPRR
ncbi:MAG TPA: polysaccharide deacetylase family protein [Candidatus Paceibacterota bacterium]|nr:polysaccharide deacetylase family protein [Candidatus Paceibacterota bacterium]